MYYYSKMPIRESDDIFIKRVENYLARELTIIESKYVLDLYYYRGIHADTAARMLMQYFG